jgi:hypothetical protein
MNTGIQDAHNLAWKLAGVLREWASPRLLRSDETERRPVAEFNAAQSEHNAVRTRSLLARGGIPAVLGEPGAAGAAGAAGDAARASLAPAIERQRPHFDFQGQALGFRYPPPGGPTRDKPVPPVADVVIYTPAARVGMRGPHGWLERGETRLSPADLSRDGFALLAAAGSAPAWSHVVDRVRLTVPAPIVCFPIATGPVPGALLDPTGGVVEVYGLHGQAAVLLRPDGHVAARLPGADPEDELRQALATSVTGSVEEGIRT